MELLSCIWKTAFRPAGHLRRQMTRFCVVTAMAANLGAAHAGTVKDYDLKAVFLFNFAQFVDWPSKAFADARSPIVIGILGEDPFGKSLDQVVQGEVINERRLVVKRYRRVEEIDTCHILFISKSEASQLNRVLTVLKNRPILTVGETDGFAASGGMIRFFPEQNKIRLRINQDAARAANLKLSSKLLRVAYEIVETTAP